jgi:hypothetical protein
MLINEKTGGENLKSHDTVPFKAKKFEKQLIVQNYKRINTKLYFVHSFYI